MYGWQHQVVAYTSNLLKCKLLVQCHYSNRGTLRKLTNQDVLWEQRIATFFVNGPMTFTNANNTFRTNLKTRQPLRVDVHLSGNMSSFWLVTFDPKLLMFQRATSPHGKGFHVQRLFPNRSSEMESWGGHISPVILWIDLKVTATEAFSSPIIHNYPPDQHIKSPKGSKHGNISKI